MSFAIDPIDVNANHLDFRGNKLINCKLQITGGINCNIENNTFWQEIIVQDVFIRLQGFYFNLETPAIIKGNTFKGASSFASISIGGTGAIAPNSIKADICNNSFLDSSIILSICLDANFVGHQYPIGDFDNNIIATSLSDPFRITSDINTPLILTPTINIRNSLFPNGFPTNPSFNIDTATCINDNPLIDIDTANYTYTLRWNENEKSPCIMAGYSLYGKPFFDKPDIGAIQYSERPHTFQTYEFPSTNYRNGIKWMSFPTVDWLCNNPIDQEMAFNLFHPLRNDGILNNIKFKFPGDGVQTMSITEGSFDGNNHQVLPQYGYKFTMSQELEDQFRFYVAGLMPDLSTTPIELFAFQNSKTPGDDYYYENWIGYFGTRTISPMDAFGPFLDNLFFIQAQDWAMSRDYQNQWVAAIAPNEAHPQYTLRYGDMVVVKCRSDMTGENAMHWSSGGTELEPYEKEDLERFHYEEQTEYIPFFIDFEGSDLPKEVGIYIENVCKGGAVVVDKLVEVPAYILEDLPDYPEIEFRLYYESKANDVIPCYKTMNIKNGSYENKSLVIREKQDYYRVKINTNSSEVSPVPKVYVANYPNPFNPNTKIEYYLPKDTDISIDIINVKGQVVNKIVTGYQTMGIHTINWNGRDSKGKSVGSGVYFAKLNYDGKQITKKMILTK